MTMLYLVRHGEATGNIERRFHGWFDSDLTENGRKQIQRLRMWFQSTKIDAIYSSDLKRTRDTAAIIAEEKNLRITEMKQLREIHGGKWEDVPWDTLPIEYAESYNNWLHYPHLLEMPNGESMQAFQDRISDAIFSIIETNRDKHVAVVTHGTAIRVLLCKIRNIPLSEMPNEGWCDNASVTVLKAEGDMIRIIKDGDNSHLGELSTLAKQDWWKK